MITEQLEQLIPTLSADKPLLLVDADEVILRFMDGLAEFLLTQQHELRLEGFRISGNIYCQRQQIAVNDETINQLIDHFWDQTPHTIQAVSGAKEALNSLNELYDIAILTNLPHRARAARQKNLTELGMMYPVLTNQGGKGQAIKALSEHAAQGIVFIDDLPPQHTSAATHAPECHRIHKVSHPKLRPMIGKAEDAHIRIDEWDEIHQYLREHIRNR